MSLNRITLASETMQDFIMLNRAKQQILYFLLLRRNMRKPPLRPTNYFSHAAIAEGTGLKETTVRLSIAWLQKEDWITQISQRKQFTPTGEIEKQYRWILTKVVEGLEEARRNKRSDSEQENNS